MGQVVRKQMNAEDFLAWQAGQPELFELVDGHPRPYRRGLTEGARAFDRVLVNLLRELSVQLRGSRFQPATATLAVRTGSGDLLRSALLVEPTGGMLKGGEAAEPLCLIEIMSPALASYDGIRKLDAYRTIRSLGQIILFDTDFPQATSYQRERDRSWSTASLSGLGTTIDLPMIGARLMLADVYEGVHDA